MSEVLLAGRMPEIVKAEILGHEIDSIFTETKTGLSQNPQFRRSLEQDPPYLVRLHKGGIFEFGSRNDPVKLFWRIGELMYFFKDDGKFSVWYQRNDGGGLNMGFSLRVNASHFTDEDFVFREVVLGRKGGFTGRKKPYISYVDRFGAEKTFNTPRDWEEGRAFLKEVVQPSLQLKLGVK